MKLSPQHIGILGGVIASILIFSASGALHAQEPNDPTCQLDKKNMYANQDISTEEVMVTYHSIVNEQFNTYIQTMLSADPTDPNGKAPESEKECTLSNFSSFCVAYTLTTDPEFGYLAYRKALSCRKSQLYETAKDKDLWDKYIEYTNKALVPPKELQDEVTARELNLNQADRFLRVSTRLSAVDREIESSKRALDKTLAAYNELRQAWPMHQKYMEIYTNLLKYRDKMVEMRHQVEEFPAKFIDVTTTQCT